MGCDLRKDHRHVSVESVYGLTHLVDACDSPANDHGDQEPKTLVDELIDGHP